MPTSAHLDRKSEPIVERLARMTGRTKSDITREAIERLEASMDEPSTSISLYDRIVDLLGMGHGGPRDLAARSEELLHERLGRPRAPQ